MLRSDLETQPRSQGEDFKMEVVYSHQTVSGNHPDLGKLFTHSTICAVYPLLAVDDKSGTEFLWISPQNSNKIAYHWQCKKHILSVASSKIIASNLPLFPLEN